MATTPFDIQDLGIESRAKSHVERIPSARRQASYLKGRMSRRGAGVDVIDLVGEEIDPTADYASNVKDIKRKYGFVGEKQIGVRRAKEQQCSTEISMCRGSSVKSACEFACEECKDSESCDELEEIEESGGKSWEERILAKEKPKPAPAPAPVVTKKSVYVTFKGVKKHRMRCPKCGRAAVEDFCMVHGDVKALDLETSKKAQELTTEVITAQRKWDKAHPKSAKERKAWERKQVKKEMATPKRTPKLKVKKPIARKPKAAKIHEKVLTDKQIREVRKHGYCYVTINGIKKRITKKNVPSRKRTVYWYLSGTNKVSVKVMR